MTDPDNRKAKWLAYAAEDRYLMKVGKPQVWGTQLKRKMNDSGSYDIYYLENFDKGARTNAQRVKCDMPTLPEIESRLKRMVKLEYKAQQYQIWKTGK